ncbi:unnamed protein product, partial [Mesorhabditis belari]|uniref:Uncharacterized protein n=1 Tax=Mesorhabditis belari TaxID=2138241 RepID=A0AAF3EZT4_9BILA
MGILECTLLFLIAILRSGEGLALDHDSYQLPQGTSTYKNGAATVIQLGEKGTQDLFDRWISQAMSGLFAAVAQKHINDVNHFEREIHQNCSKIAKDVPDHAKCVARLLRAAEETIKKVTNRNYNNPNLRWEGAFRVARMKRETRKITRQSSYTLHHAYDEPPFAQIARYMTSGVRAFQGKTKKTSWQQILADIHTTADEDRMEKRRKKAMMRRLRSWIDNTPTKLEDGWRTQALEMMDDQLKKKEEMLKKAKATEDVRVPLKVLREAIKLGMSLSGQNMTNFDKKTLRVGSPRFFSLVKGETEDDMVNLFSPSLFSMHEDGSKTENLFSLPHLLKRLTKKEQDAWMDFIVEASGVGDAVESARFAKKTAKEAALKTPDGTPLYFNKKNLTDMYGKQEGDKVDLFEKMAHKYDDKQKSALDKDGFAFMTKEQVEIMYGKESPYHDRERIDEYKNFVEMRDEDKHQKIRNEILEIGDKALRVSAQNVTELARKHGAHRRSKRNIVLSPIVNTPLIFASAIMSNTFIVLSPVVFSPVILSPAVLGPIILSPWVFIPVILSPRVLSPLIVNPLIFSPVILSPLVLHPFILSPGIFNPFILSPFVLSPFILSPQVFTPVILSPFALSPVILTPMVGSPLVLSPFVLSPIILSPQALFAVVLSPYALSPLVESKLIASEVILSPSFLS